MSQERPIRETDATTRIINEMDGRIRFLREAMESIASAKDRGSESVEYATDFARSVLRRLNEGREWPLSTEADRAKALEDHLRDLLRRLDPDGAITDPEETYTSEEINVITFLVHEPHSHIITKPS